MATDLKYTNRTKKPNPVIFFAEEKEIKSFNKIIKR